MRRFIKTVIFILLFLIITALVTIGAVNYFNEAPGILVSGDIVFSIQEGDTLNIIADSLLNTKLIKSSRLLVLYSRIMRTESKFKVGVYNINPEMTLIEIHDQLIEGRQQLYKITIPEGWTSLQIADYLEYQQITAKTDFLKAINSIELIKGFDLEGYNLEGFLYPDTYLFQKNYPADMIVTVMVNNFFERLNEIHSEYKDMELINLMDKIILASIIEREYRDPEEAPLMAGVFYNRLSKINPIPLGSCATIAYIITDIQGKKHPEIILYSDLEIDSPYNTYMNTGLPPGPISNPGEIALKAAFYPENSNYLYFLLKNPESGQHEFTRNLSEHTAAYNLYIKQN
jgi:peptidoglycan lytic transglycosylase G